MKRLAAKSAVYLALAVAGFSSAVYSIMAKNYILLVISVVFALVSADNIFCNLRDQDGARN